MQVEKVTPIEDLHLFPHEGNAENLWECWDKI